MVNYFYKCVCKIDGFIYLSSEFCVFYNLYFWYYNVFFYFLMGKCLSMFVCREFDYNDVLRLWEVFWSYYLFEYFYLYMCVVILKRYCCKIMDE